MKKLPTILVMMGLFSCSSFAQSPAKIDSFKDCVAAGYKILKSYPPRCVAPDGRIFEEEVQTPPGKRLCRDLCGDGICQTIVCMAEGCPCAESEATCPGDCTANVQRPDLKK